jgi:very-short-patch-repair endonuclease
MDDTTRRMNALAEGQRGLVTRDQLRALGRTSRQIDRSLARGTLLRVQPGVYRMAGTAVGPDLLLAAGLLMTRGVASHRSAARLLGLVERWPSIPEVTVEQTATFRRSGLILHRSSDLQSSDILRIDGLRCTNATRTLIDLGAVVDDRQLESALERALYLRLTAISRLESRLGEIARHGRPGVAALRRVLETRPPGLAPTASELELLIWRILRQHRVPLPERQVPVTVSGHRFFLDMAYPAEQIFLEGDGFGVHGGREAFESDRWRQNLLVVAGWLPLRFTDRQARRARLTIVEQVHEALALRRRRAMLA